MQRRAQAFVLSVDIEAFILEVGNCNWLISLSRDVKHVDALVVNYVDICTMLDK